jgi:hypothetical protein
MLTIVGAIAQFERELMLERQRTGIAKAKTEGRYKGPKPTAMARAGKVRQLKGMGSGRSRPRATLVSAGPTSMAVSPDRESPSAIPLGALCNRLQNEGDGPRVWYTKHLSRLRKLLQYL